MYLEFSAHSVSFTTSSLPVCKTGGHSSFENRLDQWAGRAAVNHIVAAILIESKIKAKLLILQVLGQIYL